MATNTWTLTCLNAVFNPNGKTLHGDNIIVPQQILEEIQVLERTRYQFVIKNATETQMICCRVEEFCSGNDMHIYMPAWIMHNLYLNDMDEIKLCLLDPEIPPAKKIIVQPHDSIFLTLDNHKSVLENSLKNFSSLTAGTSISVHHDGEEYPLSIVAVEPTHQFVSLIDTDVEVEFLPPLDYVEVKPSDWPDSEQWPLDPDVYIKEEICTTPKEYVLSDGKRIILRPPTPVPAPAPAPAPTPVPAPDPPQEQNNGFIAFSGKGHRLTD
jgi:hypothetical protein